MTAAPSPVAHVASSVRQAARMPVLPAAPSVLDVPLALAARQGRAVPQVLRFPYWVARLPPLQSKRWRTAQRPLCELTLT